MATIIDGKQVSGQIKQDLKSEVDSFINETGVQPGLATILVGSDTASQVYVKNKIKFTQNCGMHSVHHAPDASISEEELLSLIDKLNLDSKVHGILVQLPLPKHINSDKIISSINPKKDVDGFHPYNMGLLMSGNAKLQPCTPLGIIELLKFYEIDLQGKDVVIIGRSNIVGKPQAMMMLKANATVTICHSKTKNLTQKIKQADVIVAAIGKAKFVQGDWVKEGAIIIDVGINRDENNKLCGDVDFSSVEPKAKYITPVPGGVGPMTIAMLLVNTLKAAKDIVNQT
ncbi:bifunctional methylenetetrahydrofolate dehydrogenase/methenyltetrahydrofolate cyclohydrolase [bacterium K02(2017)]|nr:bifunctional methylenetetrahydrofolate dehydrogenase/methenyltetrahydrofolate cyclohydrolase [bacterium K02(2017)]